MDLYCPLCAETHGLDALHDQADTAGRTFDAVREDFYVRGCVAVGASHGPFAPTPERHTIAGIYERLGDDVDGAMFELEDYMRRNNDSPI
jgi:hypothetical protein